MLEFNIYERTAAQRVPPLSSRPPNQRPAHETLPQVALHRGSHAALLAGALAAHLVRQAARHRLVLWPRVREIHAGEPGIVHAAADFRERWHSQPQRQARTAPRRHRAHRGNDAREPDTPRRYDVNSYQGQEKLSYRIMEHFIDTLVRGESWRYHNSRSINCSACKASCRT